MKTSAAALTRRPRASAPVLSLLALVAWLALSPGGMVQAQQVYRIVGPDGKVTFSDRPPEKPSEKAATVRTAGTAADANSSLPSELRQVANQYPVTVYSTRDCSLCEEARQWLVRRGIPFAEKTINTKADVDALRKLSGSDTVPSLSIGSQFLKGLQEAEWSNYLDAAGYPRQIQLPPAYRRPAAVALVPAEAAPAAPVERKPAPAAPAVPVAPQRTSPTNPAGIQF